MYLDSRFGMVMNGGAHLFWLQDQLIIPSTLYEFNVSVPFVAVPLTYYNVELGNRLLHVVYDGGAEARIELPIGNHSIDELIDVINRRLINGFKASYSEQTNTVTISTQAIGNDFEIGSDTTCGELIGVRVADRSVLGTYKAHNGVNLSGTNSLYIRSNLRTRNRDPRSLGYSNIICNVPITKAHNGLERFSQTGYSFAIRDRTITYIILEILDDQLKPVIFHGGNWQVTLEFSVASAESYNAPIDYRALMANGSLDGATDPPADQRQNPAGGGPERAPRPDRGSGQSG